MLAGGQGHPRTTALNDTLNHDGDEDDNSFAIPVSYLFRYVAVFGLVDKLGGWRVVNRFLGSSDEPAMQACYKYQYTS